MFPRTLALASVPLLMLLGPVACTFVPSSNSIGGELPCDDGVVDLWRVDTAYESAVISVDTVSPASTFDPAVEAWSVDWWGASVDSIELGYLIDSADDTFPCTYPPSAYECPAISTPPTDDMLVAVRAVGACAGPYAEYELEVSAVDWPADFTYLGQVESSWLYER